MLLLDTINPQTAYGIHRTADGRYGNSKEIIAAWEKWECFVEEEVLKEGCDAEMKRIYLFQGKRIQ